MKQDIPQWMKDRCQWCKAGIEYMEGFHVVPEAEQWPECEAPPAQEYIETLEAQARQAESRQIKLQDTVMLASAAMQAANEYILQLRVVAYSDHPQKRAEARTKLAAEELASNRMAARTRFETAFADLGHSDASRWEIGLRNIVTILVGPRTEFEIPQIVERVRGMHGELAEVHACKAAEVQVSN